MNEGTLKSILSHAHSLEKLRILCNPFMTSNIVVYETGEFENSMI